MLEQGAWMALWLRADKPLAGLVKFETASFLGGLTRGYVVAVPVGFAAANLRATGAARFAFVWVDADDIERARRLAGGAGRAWQFNKRHGRPCTRITVLDLPKLRISTQMPARSGGLN